MKLTFLVVDDDHLLRRALRRGLTIVLGGLGVTLTILEASGGQEAEAMLRERADEISFVLSDVQMKGGDGTVLEKNTRALREEHGIVFWMMSGYHSHLVPEGVRVCRKPFSMDELREMAAEILALIREREPIPALPAIDELVEDPNTGPTWPNPDNET